MNKITLEDLDEFFEGWDALIFDMKMGIDNMRRMSSAKDEYEIGALKRIGFFKFAYRQFRFMIIVNLCKIFSPSSNQRKSIFKLFNRLKSDQYDQDILDLLNENKGKIHSSRLFKSDSDILEAIKRIEAEVQSKDALIQSIIVLRDKYYAHSDIKPTLPKVSEAELDEMIELAMEIYNDIRGNLLDRRMLFEKNMDWHVNPLLKLAGEHQERFSKLQGSN